MCSCALTSQGNTIGSWGRNKTRDMIRHTNYRNQTTVVRTDVAARMLRVAVLFFPLVFVAGLVWLKLERPWSYAGHVSAADGPLEWATGLVYLLACLLSAVIGVRLCRQRQRLLGVLWMLIAAALFLASGNEVGWGQSPINLQAIDFHSERGLQCEIGRAILTCGFPLETIYILVGFYGVFSRLLCPGTMRTRYPLAADLLTPQVLLLLYFLPALVLYLYLDYLSMPLVDLLGSNFDFSDAGQAHPHLLQIEDRRPVHFLLALGWLFWMIRNFYRATSSRLRVRA